MIIRLLPNTRAQPVGRCASMLALESHLRSACPTPLMDLAGQATARLALAVALHARRVWIVAGPGNNGGDGLQAAMDLQQEDRRVQVSLLGDPQQLPAEARRAHARALQAGVDIQLCLPGSAPELTAQDLCIDALLGIGATRAPQDDMLQAIGQINSSAATVLAVDLPSGLAADSGQPLGSMQSVVQADHTLTLLGAKPGLFMGHGRDACGTLWLAPLAEAAGIPSADAELNPPAAPAWRRHASHKGSHGDVAVVGGESLGTHGTGMTGAAVLAAQAAQAALQAGAGRVMLCLLGQQEFVPSATADLMRRDLQALDLPRLTVVAGCGAGQSIAQALGGLLQRSARLVLDADALNRVAEDVWLQRLLTQRSTGQRPTVLTPHPLEAARLLGVTTSDVQADRLEAARQLAQRFDCCVILKGSGTVIAAPGQTPRINTTGNGRLAIGGTGDVLAGLIGARLAATGQAWPAACDAVWTHGQCADAWPEPEALTASRLADRLR